MTVFHSDDGELFVQSHLANLDFFFLKDCFATSQIKDHKDSLHGSCHIW